MKKYNLLLPIAGRAQRFLDEGYFIPKPLIMAGNRSIIERSMHSMESGDCQLIFIVQKEHVLNFAIDKILKQKFGDDIIVIILDGVTQGATETCLYARDYIDNDQPLIIYTPDVCFYPRFLPQDIPVNADGLILTFKANSPAHSYAIKDVDGFVLRTVEKQVVSNDAAVGVYAFKRGSDFVEAADRSLANKEKTNGEYYLCPLYNHLIAKGQKIVTQEVEKMHVLGTPRDLEFFVDNALNEFGQKPIALCCDHSGFELKESAKLVLEQMGICYIDWGCYVNQDCDYNDYVKLAAKAIANKQCDFGLGFCRSGQGVNIFANHLKGIRSALVFDEYMMEYAVRHNCANFFAIPQKYVDKDLLYRMLYTCRRHGFDGGRHFSRIWVDSQS